MKATIPLGLVFHTLIILIFIVKCLRGGHSLFHTLNLIASLRASPSFLMFTVDKMLIIPPGSHLLQNYTFSTLTISLGVYSLCHSHASCLSILLFSASQYPCYFCLLLLEEMSRSLFKYICNTGTGWRRVSEALADSKLFEASQGQYNALLCILRT